MSFFRVTPEQMRAFHSDGYFVAEGLLQPMEVDLLRKIARSEYETAETTSRADGEGGAIRLHVEHDVADDVYGAIVSSRRIVNTMEQLLDGEVYHYHHKLILKEPRTGGAWAWHQDYGYWYNNGCLFPQLASCLIAVDRATRENGCLQVIRGSHQIGRVDHMKVGDQTGADPERVEAALNRLERVYVELEPGSAVIFHCNLLHRSDQNTSENPRWALIACYNAAANNPYKKSRHPCYTPLTVMDDAEVARVATRQWDQIQRVTVEGG